MSDNPYLAARQEWNELFAGPLQAKKLWQRVAFGQSAALALLAGGFVYQAAHTQVIPYVVEVDSIGRAVAAAPAERQGAVDARIVKAMLFRFIETARGVSSDPAVMTENLTFSYNLASPGVRQNFLTPYYAAAKPFEQGKRLTRAVQPVSFLAQSAHSYLLEWKETERDRDNKLLQETRWKALASVIAQPADSLRAIEENPQNPFGITITQLSWSQEF